MSIGTTPIVIENQILEDGRVRTMQLKKNKILVET